MWVIMPVLNNPEQTVDAISDVLALTPPAPVDQRPTRLLVVNQGVDDDFRHLLERLAEAHPRLLVWSHQPPLPSLAATWNRALDFVWNLGEGAALVVNNDVRLRRDLLALLMTVQPRTGALFVSGVGVTEAQFDATAPIDVETLTYADDKGDGHPVAPGGPDFSCFLITLGCHTLYRFDEGFTPAFCEDLDYHRRLMLDGEAARIFSVNVPFLHFASQTIKRATNRAVIDLAIEHGSRAHYRAKWGGPVNAEKWWYPYGIVQPNQLTVPWPCEPTTPALQAYFQEQARVKDLKARRCYTCDWLWTGDVACPKCGNDPRQEAGDA